MSEVLVKADHVSKKFCKDLKTGLWYGVQDLGKNLFGNHSENQLRPKEFWAVNDISFEVKRGECLGLLGHNGAGKSTLLKVINGLLSPDKGRIEMHGRVNALIELGAGFNPILTGRENIFNNAAVLGISEKETKKKLDEIIAFSELEEFIDTPVQYYSSGMKVKLGFSVAAHLEPDILILDEVLAVGDAGFKIKSFNKMMELMKSCAVLFVSHAMPSVARVCNKVIYMEHGKSLYYGEDVHHGIEMYFDQFSSERSKIEFNDAANIENISINGEPQSDNLKSTIYGEDFKLKFNVNILDKKVEDFYIIIQITDKDLKIVANFFTNKFAPNFNAEDHNEIEITFPELLLIDGEYQITYAIATHEKFNKNQYRHLALYRNYTSFKVKGLQENVYAAIYLKGSVSHNGKVLN
ncbi:ABC transporter ATP-binding protein [Chryseobacterium echinoideorum]|uniref:ABC transporter ATP-binding protein n=1 Tax=Chryseobacterium echinoideorum TaxID=1549648 RepID=UPI00118584B0|nr:ABC transporter ATP-binding protein [Chryseobacterium echinoideorum]